MNAKQKRIALVAVVIVIVALSLVAVFSQSLPSKNTDAALARVACMGDSITNITAYPADLQALLGSSSVVGAFGYNGAAVNLWADRAYWGSEPYRDARSFAPTTVILMLGTNDARTNLEGNVSDFVGDYERMLQRIQDFSSKPQIYLVIPPPIFDNDLNLNSSFYMQEIIPRIHKVANDMGLPVIDVYTPLVGHSEYFLDGAHPNAQGAQIIANTIYQAITKS
jgi:lysophospholipase L1-like esterase